MNYLFLELSAYGIIGTFVAVAELRRWYSNGRVVRDAARRLGLEMLGRCNASGLVHGIAVSIDEAGGDSRQRPPFAFLVTVRTGRIPEALTVESVAAHQGFFRSLERVTVGDASLTSSSFRHRNSWPSPCSTAPLAPR